MHRLFAASLTLVVACSSLVFIEMWGCNDHNTFAVDFDLKKDGPLRMGELRKAFIGDPANAGRCWD